MNGNGANKSGIASIKFLLATSIVVISGAATALNIQRNVLGDIHSDYNLKIEQADWISCQKSSSVAYFRKKIYINDKPLRAWIEFCATDSLAFYVNDQRVFIRKSDGKVVKDIVDLSNIFDEGENLIAIEVNRKSVPGEAAVMAQLNLIDKANQTLTFDTDAKWKASSTPQEKTTLPPAAWFSRSNDDLAWLPARLVAEPKYSQASHLSLPPVILKETVDGPLLSHPELVNEISFFTWQGTIEDINRIFLRIYGSKDREVYVNDILIDAPARSANVITILDITPYVRISNHNKIIIRVHPKVGPPILNCQIFGVDKKGTALKYDGIVGNWTVRTELAPEEVPVVELTGLNREKFSTLKRIVESNANLSPVYQAQMLIFKVCLLVSGIFLFLAAWYIGAVLMEGLTGFDYRKLLLEDALYHLPLIPTSVILNWLESSNQPDSWAPSKSLIITFGLWLFLKILCYTTIWITGKSATQATTRSKHLKCSRSPLPVCLMLLFICVIALALRYTVLFHSFDHDEQTLVLASQGIKKSYYPHVYIGSILKNLTTYELTTYPIALAEAIFGSQEWALRMPAMFFSIGTLLLIFLGGKILFNTSTGLLAALFFAINPLSINFGANVFYPQQMQFFSLATILFFYKAIHPKPFNTGYLIGSTLCFLCCYLSWEGSGFLLLALVGAYLTKHRDNWKQLLDFRLLSCVIAMVLVIIIQRAYRVISSCDYIAVGFNLNSLNVPFPNFNDISAKQLFYIKKLVFTSVHFWPGLIFVAGSLFRLRSTAFRYIFFVGSILLTSYSLLLPVSAIRYGYMMQTVLFLGASAVIISVYHLIRRLSFQPGAALTVFIVRLCTLLLMGMLLIHSNDYLSRQFQIGSSSQRFLRNDIYNIDYRGAHRFVKERHSENDLIMVRFGHLCKFYVKKAPDYVLNIQCSDRMFFDPAKPEPCFIDRFSGSPIITNVEQFRDVLNHHSQKTWVVAAPYKPFERSMGTEFMNLLNSIGYVAYETYNAKVYCIDRFH